MAAALVAQADTQPTPATLPIAGVTSSIGRQQTAATMKRRGHASDVADAAHQGQGPSAATIYAAHAASDAAGQAQAKRAKERISHLHPGH